MFSKIWSGRKYLQSQERKDIDDFHRIVYRFALKRKRVWFRLFRIEAKKKKNWKWKRAGNKRNEAKKSKRNVKEPENCLTKKMLKVFFYICVPMYWCILIVNMKLYQSRQSAKMLVLACTIYMGHGCSASVCAMLLQGNVKKCFLLSLSKTVVHRSPVWQARGSNLDPVPHGRLFLQIDSNGFSRGSRRFFLGVFSKYHKFAEGVSEALMGGVEGPQRPILHAKEPEKTGALTDRQNPQVKKY